MNGPSPTLEELARAAEFLNQSAPLAHAGIRVSFPATDLVVAEIPTVRDEHRGGLGSSAVNGGVLAALFDLVTGCTSLLVAPGRRSATVQLSMSFERPVFGDTVRAEAHPLCQRAPTRRARAGVRTMSDGGGSGAVRSSAGGALKEPPEVRSLETDS